MKKNILLPIMALTAACLCGAAGNRIIDRSAKAVGRLVDCMSDLRREVSESGIASLRAAKKSLDNEESHMRMKGVQKAPMFHVDINSDGLVMLPMSIWPSAEKEEDKLFFAIDANNDGYTWNYSSYFEEFELSSYDDEPSYDDWLFLPAFDVKDTEHLHSFSFHTYSYGEYAREIEIYIGDDLTTEGMIQIGSVWSTRDWTNDEVSLYFMPSAKGKTTLALRAKENIAAAYDFKVEATDITAVSPNAVNDVVIDVAPEGRLAAEVTFTMPEVTVSGDELDKSKDYSVSVSNEAGMYESKGKPGERVSIGIDMVQGFSKMEIRVGNGGPYITKEVFSGIDRAIAPTIVMTDVSDDNYSANIEWAAPANGVNGGYVDASVLSYVLTHWDESIYEETTVAETSSLNATFTLPEGSPQKAYNLFLTVIEADGTQGESTRFDISMGMPYEIPFGDSPIIGKRGCQPYMNAVGERYTTTWGYFDTSVCGEEAAEQYGEYAIMLGCKNYADENAVGGIVLPKFSTVGVEEPLFTFNTFFSDSMPDIEVYAKTPHGERTLVSKVDVDSYPKGYQNVVCLFPSEFAGCPTVEVSIDVIFNAPKQYMLLPRYDFTAGCANDLAAVSVSGSLKPRVGEESTYTARIQNVGYEAVEVSEFACTLVRDGKTIHQLTPVKDLEAALLRPWESLYVDFSIVTDANMTGDCTVRFSLMESDMRDSNDTFELPVKVIVGERMVVTDLHVESADDQTVTLAWSKPAVAEGLLDFEEEDPFVITDGIGDFKNIDNDGFTTTGYAFPYYTWSSDPCSWVVWNSDIVAEAPYNNDIYPASGKQWLAVLSPSWEDMADDWLVSPEIAGGSTVSFDMSAMFIDTEFLDIMYSTTDDALGSFKRCKSLQCAGEHWDRYEVTLPEDARYFALRYCSYPASEGSCGLMIDNLEYTPVMASAVFTGYDIYRNNSLIESDVASDCRYVDADAYQVGCPVYEVVPVYLFKGETLRGDRSNSASPISTSVAGISYDGTAIATAGGVIIKGLAGQAVKAVAADGKLMADFTGVSGDAFVPLAKGVYVITVGGAGKKLIVR